MTVAVPISRDAQFRVGQVYYNGITLPPAIHSNATFTPVYDQSGRVRKYIKGKLHIEAYIFPGCLGTESVGDGRQELNYFPAPSLTALTDGSGNDCTTETVMTSIRTRLSEPCRELQFTYQGVGKISLNGVYGPKDVDNGPKPKEVLWTPLTNKMAKITWECEFSFSPCADTVSGTTPSPYAEFPFEVSLSVGPGGLSTRIITGSLEIGLTRWSQDVALIGGNPISQPFDMQAMQKYVLKHFPILKQFKREESFKISKDRKHLDFTITDTEINSDDSFGPGIEHEEAKISIEGNLHPGAFRSWAYDLSGHIDLMAGYPKSFAFVEIARLFNHYFLNLAKSGLKPFTSNLPKWVEGLDLINNSGSSASFPLLRRVKIDDEIFGRSIRFNFNWTLFVRLEDLFKTTGLFQPVQQTNTERNNAWDLWKLSSENVMDAVGYQKLGFTENNDVIVDLCVPAIGKPMGITTIPDYIKKQPDKPVTDPRAVTTDPYPIDATDAFHYYDSSIQIKADHGTLNHQILNSSPAMQGLADLGIINSKQVQLTKRTVNPDYFTGIRTIQHKIRPTIYTLTFQGAAIRLNYPITSPEVQSYGGEDCMKIGSDYIKPFKLGNGVDVTSGKNYSIHGLVWQKTYALPGIPINNEVVSDGLSVQYPVA